MIASAARSSGSQLTACGGYVSTNVTLCGDRRSRRDAAPAGRAHVRTLGSSGKHPSAAARCTSDGNQPSASGAQAPLGAPHSVLVRTMSGSSRVRTFGAAAAAYRICSQTHLASAEPVVATQLGSTGDSEQSVADASVRSCDYARLRGARAHFVRRPASLGRAPGEAWGILTSVRSRRGCELPGFEVQTSLGWMWGLLPTLRDYPLTPSPHASTCICSPV